MNLDEYQEETRRTRGDASLGILALGLAGETGEVVELVKKHLGHGHELDRDRLRNELGDVLWYLASLADVAGINLDVVAMANVAKLRARYPHGFDSERSKRREE